VLTTDDLAMHALTGSPGARAARALAAGCDVALHCSGVLADSADLLESIPPATDAALARLLAAAAQAVAARVPLDIQALTAERAGLLPC
jgi:beta-N-acetylhexosaminidase